MSKTLISTGHHTRIMLEMAEANKRLGIFLPEVGGNSFTSKINDFSTGSHFVWNCYWIVMN